MAKADKKKSKDKSKKKDKSKSTAPKAAARIKPAPKVKKPAKAAPVTKPTRTIVKPFKTAVGTAKKNSSAKTEPAAVLKAAPVQPRKPVKLAPFVEKQKQRLIELRDHILEQMQGVAQDTLRVKAEGSEASAFGMHQADAGSDAYDKDFALSLLSQEQDALYEIEEALKRIDGGTYGTCEMSNKLIPHARLEAIPHARFTVECQAKLERENRGRRRWDTVPQFMDSAESLVDEDDEGSEDDERRKEKD